MGQIKKIITRCAQLDLMPDAAQKFHRWLLHHADMAETDDALAEVWDSCRDASEDTTDAYRRFCRTVGVAPVVEMKPEPKQHTIQRLSTAWKAIAASVVWGGSVAATYWITSDRYDEGYMTEVNVPYGEIRSVLLPDGSTVQLNSGSTLLYPQKFKKDIRSVYLFGEAVFTVESDSIHPFVVKASGIDITARGTQFNVCAYPNQRKVTTALIEGKVQVSCENKEWSYTLTPGQKLVYDNVKSAMVLEEFEAEDALAWRDEQFIFQSATIFEIFDAIERRCNLTILYNRQDFNDDKYSIRFKAKVSLEGMMNILKQVVGDMEYEIDYTQGLPQIIVTRE